MIKVRFSIKIALSLVCVSGVASGAETVGKDTVTAPVNALSVDCRVGVQTPADVTDELKEVYAKIKEKCAYLQLNDVTVQTNNAKAQEIGKALSGFSSIVTPTGTITGVDRADHIGIWYAKALLYRAAAKAGLQIKAELAIQPSVVVIEPANLQNKAILIAARAQLQRHSNSMGFAANSGNKAVKFSEVREDEVPPEVKARMGLIPLLSIVPPVISAAQSLGGLFRETTTLSPLTIQPDNNIILSGLSACLDADVRKKFTIPRYATRPNSFMDLYDGTQLVAVGARVVLDNLVKSLAVLDKKTDEVSIKKKNLLNDNKTVLESALNSFEQYDKFLNSPPVGGQNSRFETLIDASEALGADGSARLIVHVAHVGGNGGTVSRAFGSDKLQYMATAQVTYVLIDKDGNVVKSGTVIEGDGSGATVSATISRIKSGLDLNCSNL